MCHLFRVGDTVTLVTVVEVIFNLHVRVSVWRFVSFTHLGVFLSESCGHVNRLVR